MVGNIIGDVSGDLSGIVGNIAPNLIYATDVTASSQFIGNIQGNVSGHVDGNLIGQVGDINNEYQVIGSTIKSTNLFIGDLSGIATTVTDGIYIGDEVTKLNDIIDSGSGQIITDAERNKLSSIEDNANHYILPIATKNLSGGVTIGDNINIDSSGVISITNYIANYSLDISNNVFSINHNDLSDNLMILTGNQ